MKKMLFLTIGAAAAVAVWVGAAAGGPAAQDACKPGVITYGGTKALVFCGRAKAVLKAGGKTITIAGGRCELRQLYLRFDVGTKMLGPTSEPKPNYFGFAVGRTPGSAEITATKDGNYTALFGAAYDGLDLVKQDTRGKITLKKNRTTGTFSVKGVSGPVTGTFTC